MAIAPNRAYFKLNPYRKQPRSLPAVPPVTPPDTPSPPDTTPFYSYQDVYGDLLTQLASLRDLQLGSLKTDLEGRSKAVQGIVESQRNPLNANYSQAIQEAAAVNDAVANRLGTQGAAGQEDLRSKLASLGQDPTAATADLSKYYSGLGGANYAMDAGDVQRLIGRKAEENTLLDKQPSLIRQQLESGYSKDIEDVLSNYMQNVFGLKQSQAESKGDYEKAKFEFEQAQKATNTETSRADAAIARDAADKAESLYWENHWKKQDILQHRLDVAIASKNTKSANAIRKQIAANQRQTQIDIANIRAKASATAAQTKADLPKPLQSETIGGHAASFDPNTGSYYYPGTKNPIPQSTLDTWAKKPVTAKTKGATSNINRQRAYNAAIAAVIDPKLGVIRAGVNPTGYNADWTMTRIINGVLKSYGINPNTTQGRSIIKSVMSQASGRIFSGKPIDPATGKPARFKYDPNWVKGAQNAAAKKRKVETRRH